MTTEVSTDVPLPIVARINHPVFDVDDAGSSVTHVTWELQASGWDTNDFTCELVCLDESAIDITGLLQYPAALMITLILTDTSIPISFHTKSIKLYYALKLIATVKITAVRGFVKNFTPPPIDVRTSQCIQGDTEFNRNASIGISCRIRVDNNTPSIIADVSVRGDEMSEYGHWLPNGTALRGAGKFEMGSFPGFKILEYIGPTEMDFTYYDKNSWESDDIFTNKPPFSELRFTGDTDGLDLGRTGVAATFQTLQVRLGRA